MDTGTETLARILVIEDDAQERDILRRLLERMGHVVAVAENGTQGLQLYFNEPFDLVITDIVMPEREGLETIREMRRHDEGARILAISGGGDHLDAGNLLRTAAFLGARRILTKPFRRTELELAVNDVLSNGTLH